MQAQGGFPFTSKLDQEETIETQHLRDFSNYLIPREIIDVFIGVAAVVRGLLVNGLIFLGILLLLAAMTVWFEPTIKHLNRPILVGDQFAGHLFFWTMVAAAVWFLLQPITTIFSRQGDLQRRERSRFGLALAFICVLLLGLIEAQPYVLKGIFEAYHGKDLALAANDNIVARLLYWFGEKLSYALDRLAPCGRCSSWFGEQVGSGGAGAPWGSHLERVHQTMAKRPDTVHLRRCDTPIAVVGIPTLVLLGNCIWGGGGARAHSKMAKLAIRAYLVAARNCRMLCLHRSGYPHHFCVR